jgi:two-component system LytT family sensor kinase
MKLISIFTAFKYPYTEVLIFYIKRQFGLIKKIHIWFMRYRLHILVWVIYFIYECVVIGIIYNQYAKPIVYVTHYAIILFIFYNHEGRWFPWALRNKRTAFWKVPMVILFEICLYILFCYNVDYALIKYGYLPSGTLVFDYLYIVKNSYRCLYFIGFSSWYYIIMTYNKEKRKTEELERLRLNEIISRQKAEQELSKAQNAFLKAQINPHFLFNTLDFIYHHITSVSPVAADAVVTLAEMMRFAIDADKMGEYIRLGDEIEQVNNLLYLNHLRKNEELPFNFSCEPGLEERYIIPLVLLTLTENIFKHGDLTKGQTASLEVYSNAGMMIIASVNVSSRTRKNSNGTGLANIRKRLEYAYGNAVDVNYFQDDNNYFRVTIRIPLPLLNENTRALPSSVNTDKVLPHEHVDPS